MGMEGVRMDKKNKLTDLQDHLFELMEKLNNSSLTDEELEKEIRRSQTFSQLALVSIKNAELIATLAATYGYPASGDLPLLPASPGIIPTAQKDKKLLRNRGDDHE